MRAHSRMKDRHAHKEIRSVQDEPGRRSAGCAQLIGNINGTRTTTATRLHSHQVDPTPLS